MKRGLCIVSIMNPGGAETFLMKIYRMIDRSKYQMDFCECTDKEGFYDDEIRSLGGKIYNIPMKSEQPLKSFIELKKTVRENHYDYVWRMSNNALSVIDLIAAKLGGAKTLVFRSTNTNVSGGKKNYFLHKLFLPLAKCVPNIKIAPSTEAAEFMFGKNCIEKRKASLLHNALEYKNYSYSVSERERLRHELGIDGKFAIGHVGRFNIQKNHDFIIDIFEKIAEKNSRAVLVLVGDGELREKAEEKVRLLGLKERVIFTGVRSDSDKLLSAFDVLLFPSLFEGMPNVVIEAQAACLHCVISDTITKEADITGLVDYLSLSLPSEVWADAVLKYSGGYERHDLEQIFLNREYDIESITKRFVNLIFGR